MERTQLCLRSFVPLLKEKHSPPSSLPPPTHTCLCSPESGGWEHSVPSKEPALPPQRLASSSAGLGFVLRSPQPLVLPGAEFSSQRLGTCLHTAAQALPGNYSMGCPCPRIKQSLLFHMVINIIVNIPINRPNIYQVLTLCQALFNVLYVYLFHSHSNTLKLVLFLSPFTNQETEV